MLCREVRVGVSLEAWNRRGKFLLTYNTDLQAINILILATAHK